MTARTPCCVPFCRRTTANIFYREWICPDHWREVSLTARVDKRKWARIAKRVVTVHHPRYLGRIFARADAAWERCKREAIEAAAGISS